MNEIFDKMGKPKSIYSDTDSTFLSVPLQELFEDSPIEHIISRLHARVAERTIRTIKMLLKAEIDNNEDNPTWTAHLTEALRKYNNENEHRTIGMKPAEATEGKTNSKSEPTWK